MLSERGILAEMHSTDRPLQSSLASQPLADDRVANDPETVHASLSCPACASIECTRVGTWGSDYTACDCVGCGLRFSAPMRAADADWYQESSIYSSRTPWLAATVRSLTLANSRWEFQQALRFPAATSHSLLDVGCGYGEFLFLARQKGYSVAGLDFNGNSLRFAKDILRMDCLYESSLDRAVEATAGRRFDVVTMFEVLEHQANPFHTLRLASDLLRPEGTLCLSVPGFRRWPRLFDPQVDAPPHHLTLWTTEALQAILERAGFIVLDAVRKPLMPSDLGLVIRWKLQRALGRSSAPSPKPDYAKSGLRINGLVRHLGLIALAVPCRMLAINRKAGGFTLFARARKKLAC